MAVVRFDEVKVVEAGDITPSYVAAGTPVTENWRLCKITNNTDGDIWLSLNGTTDNIYIPARGFDLYDFATNAQNVQDSDWFVMQINSQFYIRYDTAPTTGKVVISGIYSKGV